MKSSPRRTRTAAPTVASDATPPGERTVPAGPPGFALLVMMVLIAASAPILVLAVRVLAPYGDSGDATRRAHDGVRRIGEAASLAFLTTGAFPASLDALAAAAPSLPQLADWRADPHDASQNYDYRVTGTPAVLTIRSRGNDRRLQTADDITTTVESSILGRHRMRNRLRSLRAAYLRSPFMDHTSMSATDRTAMRDAARDYAFAQRGLQHADSAAAISLRAARDAAAATITTLRTAYALPTPPATMSGGSGLLSALGLAATSASDGFGRDFVVDAQVGFRSVGGDATGGTDDDV